MGSSTVLLAPASPHQCFRTMELFFELPARVDLHSYEDLSSSPSPSPDGTDALTHVRFDRVTVRKPNTNTNPNRRSTPGAKAGSSPKTCGTCGGQGADAARIRYSLLVLTLGFLIVRSSHDAARAFPDAEHMPGVPRCRPSHR